MISKSSKIRLAFLSFVAALSASASLANAETTTASVSIDSLRAMEMNSLQDKTVSLDSLNQAQNVTSVSQLSDVKPTDWAFTALQSLVERYGCIAGYPDSTYRGKQATTRYEFAAGLNACMDKINEIISAGLSDKVSKEDLATLQKLQEEFAAELATLRGRVDALDAKTAKLEAQQFSTTTKLRGEAIFGVVAASGGPNNVQSNVIFGDRVRLLFDTSFTGKDLLRTRLEMGNLLAGNNVNTTPNTIANTLGTNTSRVGFASGASAETSNVANMNLLFYRFPVFDGKATLFAGPIAAPDDFFTPISPFASSGQGSISRFGRFDPFFRLGSTNTLFGVDYKFDDKVNLQVGYSSNSASTATGDGGLFGGTTSIAAQLLLKVANNLDASIGYANTYLPTGSLNTGLINSTANVNSGESLGIAGRSNLLSGNLVWRVNPAITFTTSGTVIFADAVTPGTSATFTSWVAGANFPNLFNEGSNGAVLLGQPLKRDTASVTPYHLELFYRYQLSKNISITPGVFWVFNPESLSANATATVGVIRTTFTF
jgi:hypothetical protein